MRKITAIAAILLASLATAGSASAQDHAARANIPFGFYVQDKWVPAGTYTLTSDSRSPDNIAIRNGESTVSLLSVGYKEDQQPGSHVLVFDRIGDKHFLREVLCSACSMNVGFSQSKREKAERTREASNGSVSTVYFALK